MSDWKEPMDELGNLLDHLVRQLCEWLSDVFPGSHVLAKAGVSIGGLGWTVLLPVDRRVGSNVWRMAHDTANRYIGADAAKTGVSRSESDCFFWGYCYMQGQPCG